MKEPSLSVSYAPLGCSRMFKGWAGGQEYVVAGVAHEGIMYPTPRELCPGIHGRLRMSGAVGGGACTQSHTRLAVSGPSITSRPQADAQQTPTWGRSALTILCSTITTKVMHTSELHAQLVSYTPARSLCLYWVRFTPLCNHITQSPIRTPTFPQLPPNELHAHGSMDRRPTNYLVCMVQSSVL